MKRVNKKIKKSVSLSDILSEIKNTNINLENLAMSTAQQFSVIIHKLTEHDKRFDEHDKKFDEIKLTELRQEVEIAHIHTLLGEINVREEKQDEKIANNFYLSKEIDSLKDRVKKLEVTK